MGGGKLMVRAWFALITGQKEKFFAKYQQYNAQEDV